MAVAIKAIFGPTSESAVAGLEENLEAKLPQDYRSFLLAHNGGMPTPNAFHIDERQGESTLAILFGIAPGDPYDLWSNAVDALEDMDRTLVPIGADPGGNKVVLSLSPDSYGQIFFRDHEEPVQRGLWRMAASFSEFMAGLHALAT
jgi:cell wall assembly regulator SMI1